MVKYILISVVLFLSISLTIYGQGVGIKTNPLGIFHIDANGDNSAYPTVSESANDVIIDNQGNVAIGTLVSATAKLSVKSLTVGGAIQVIDGLQSNGLILTSDDDGNARWSLPIPSSGKIEAILNLGPQALPKGYISLIPSSTFTAKANGYHVFEIRWHATYSVAAPRQIFTATHIRLMKNGILVDEYEAYQDVTTNATDAVTFFTSLATQANAGDVLSLEVRPGIAHGNLILAQATPLTTSKIIVKRLTIR